MRIRSATRHQGKGAPLWAADGGNGRVVPMDPITRESRVRHLLYMLQGSVRDTFPDVDELVAEVIVVQFVASMYDLQKKSQGL